MVTGCIDSFLLYLRLVNNLLKKYVKEDRTLTCLTEKSFLSFNLSRDSGMGYVRRGYCTTATGAVLLV